MTLKNTRKLYKYLDGFYFVWEFEILWAIEQRYNEILCKGSKYYWSDYAFRWEIAQRYIKSRKLKFDE